MNHHLYETKDLGVSDISTLIAVGMTPDSERTSLTDWLKTATIHFGEDGCYKAYIVDEDCDIPAYYSLVSEFKTWLKVYDDRKVVCSLRAEKIKIYRAGEFGCIIQAYGKTKKEGDCMMKLCVDFSGGESRYSNKPCDYMLVKLPEEVFKRDSDIDELYAEVVIPPTKMYDYDLDDAKRLLSIVNDEESTEHDVNEALDMLRERGLSPDNADEWQVYDELENFDKLKQSIIEQFEAIKDKLKDDVILDWDSVYPQ